MLGRWDFLWGWLPGRCYVTFKECTVYITLNFESLWIFTCWSWWNLPRWHHSAFIKHVSLILQSSLINHASFNKHTSFIDHESLRLLQLQPKQVRNQEVFMTSSRGKTEDNPKKRQEPRNITKKKPGRRKKFSSSTILQMRSMSVFGCRNKMHQ